MMRVFKLVVCFCWFCLSAALDPKRVHLIDSYPRGNNPVNFLFRGNNPVPKGGAFNYTTLRKVIVQKAAIECGVTLPKTFRILTLDFENPFDPFLHLLSLD